MLIATMIFGALLLVGFCPGSLEGQVVRGQAREESSGHPVDGAFVLLLDLNGARLAATLTDQAGRFTLRAPDTGRYQLRLERIGFEDQVSQPFDLASRQTLTHDFSARFQPIELEGITASGDARCTMPKDVGAATSVLWGEVRKALSVSEWVQSDAGVPFQAKVYHRQRDLLTLEIESQELSFRSGRGRSPFYSRSARDLGADGFVRTLPNGEIQYFGVDAATLLSNDFLETHCFRIRDSHRGKEELVGLGFEPAPSHRRPDVTGTLWLDRQNSGLVSLEFQFTQHLHPVPIPPEPFGGRVEFRRLGNGAWVVQRWWLRLPQWPASIRDTGRRISHPTQGVRDRLLEARREGLRIWEEGGELLFMAEPGPAIRGPAAVEGIVFDSTRGRPLANATVFLHGSRNRTRTDSEGRFQMSGVPEGPDQIAFLHPYTDALQLPLLREFVQLGANGPERVELHVPTGPGCPTVDDESNRSILSGVVYSAEDGEPVAGARVSAEWRAGGTGGRGAPTQEWVRGIRTTDDGRFLFCGLPVGMDLRLEAQHKDGDARADLTIHRPILIRQDLIIR